MAEIDTSKTVSELEIDGVNVPLAGTGSATDEQLQAWAEVNTALEKAVGPYTIETTTASYFTFEGGIVTGWVGPDEVTEIIIPKSYSTVTSIETFVGAKVLSKNEIHYIIRDFQSATFSDGGTNTRVYSNRMELDMLAADFPNDCYLVSMQGSDPFSFDFLQMASDLQILQFPININGQSFNDGSLAFDYILQNNITDVNFEGDGKVTKFVDGNDYQVTSIGQYAFRNCSSLTSIVIPEGITSIGGYTFQDCTSLTSITLPSSLTSVGDNAFRDCTSLTEITVPEGVTSIGGYAFMSCYKLTEITVNPNNSYYSSEDGILFNKDKTTLIQYPIGNGRTSYQISDGVTRIENYAFNHCSSLQTVDFGTNSSLQTIGAGAFQDSSSLTTITIPDKVTRIESIAFDDCSSLAEITVLAETPPTIKTNTFINVPNTAIYYVPDVSVNVYKTATNWSALANQIQPLSSKGGTN